MDRLEGDVNGLKKGIERLDISFSDANEEENLNMDVEAGFG